MSETIKRQRVRRYLDVYEFTALGGADVCRERVTTCVNVRDGRLYGAEWGDELRLQHGGVILGWGDDLDSNECVEVVNQAWELTIPMDIIRDLERISGQQIVIED